MNVDVAMTRLKAIMRRLPVIKKVVWGFDTDEVFDP